MSLDSNRSETINGTSSMDTIWEKAIIIGEFNYKCIDFCCILGI